jgi:hypothetical protein
VGGDAVVALQELGGRQRLVHDRARAQQLDVLAGALLGARAEEVQAPQHALLEFSRLRCSGAAGCGWFSLPTVT